MNRLLMLSVLAFAFGFAQMQGMEKMDGPGQPMPNYNGFVLNHAEELGISQAKIEQIKEFRKNAGPKMKSLLAELQDINSKIKAAALDGAGLEELLALEEKAEALRIKAASSKTDCRENNRKILGEEDWHKMLDLYRKLVEQKPKMELYDAMPMLGMPLMVHMNDLDLSPEQMKAAMLMPGNNMPLMDGIKAEISDLYKEIKLASFAGKTKDELLQIEKEIETKRIELMKTQVACRDEIRELLNDKQWKQLLDFYAQMQKDMPGSAAQMAEKQEKMKPMKAMAVANNKLQIGQDGLWLEPIVSDNKLYLGLRFANYDHCKMFLKATINDESSSHIVDMEKTNLLELGAVKTGVWNFSGKLHGKDFSFRLSVYKKDINSQNAYLIFAPAPSLSGLGKSQIFVYLPAANRPLNKDISISWKMPGMQHSSDSRLLELQKTNFDGSYPAVLGSKAAYTAPLSFAMVGNWDISLHFGGEEYHIPVEMLAD